MLYVTFYRLLRYLTKRNMNVSLNFVKDMQVLQYVWFYLPLILYRYMPSLFTCSKSIHVNWPTSQKTSAHKVFGLIKGWKFKIKKVLRMINVYTKNTNTIFLCWMFLSKSITILISISHEILITLYFSNAKSKQKSSKTTNKIQRS